MDRKLNKKDLVNIILGSTILSIAVKSLFDPSGLVTGGVSGLAIVIKYVSAMFTFEGIPLWLSNTLLNIPIFLFALKVDGPQCIGRTGAAWLIMTAELYFLPQIQVIPDNLLLTAIYGGICFGLGTGLLLKAKATTGGTDMLGNSLSHCYRHIGVDKMIQLLDGSVVLVGAVVFGMEQTLYAILSVYVAGKITGYVINSGRKAKIAFIISEKSEVIAKNIMDGLERGVTGFSGRGMYSGKNRMMLLCICSGRDIVSMKDIVKHYDPKAFIIIGNVSEALGEGFVENWMN